jgi:hypothetical protein
MESTLNSPKPEQPTTLPTGLSYTQKLSLVAGSMSALYMLPSTAQAAVIHVGNNPLTVGLGTGLTVDWDVDGDGDYEFFLRNRYGTFSNYDGIMREVGTFDVVDLKSDLNARGIVRLDVQTARPDSVHNLPLGFQVGPTLATGYKFGYELLRGRNPSGANNNLGDIGRNRSLLAYNQSFYSYPDSSSIRYYNDPFLGVNDARTFTGGGNEFLGFGFEDNGNRFYG